MTSRPSSARERAIARLASPRRDPSAAPRSRRGRRRPAAAIRSIAPRHAGMRERRDPAGLVDDGDDLFGRRAAPRHVTRRRRTRGSERTPRRASHVPGGQEGGGDLRPADASPARRRRRGSARRRSGQPSAASRSPISRDAAEPILALAIEERAQAGRRGVDEIAEHVHVAAVGDGADLDAGNELRGRPHAPRRRAASLPAVVS